jgi:hypothetical protein
MAREGFKLEEAARVATEIGLDFGQADFDLEQFRKGMDVELEHGKRDPETDVTYDNPLATGKIAWAHLKEIPNYYDLLAKMEGSAGDSKDEKPKRIELHMTAAVRSSWRDRFNATNSDKGAPKMSPHPKFIRVQGQLFKLEEEEPQQPEYIKVGGVVFQKVPAELIEAAKKKPKSKKKDDKKGKPAKKSKPKKLPSKDKKEKAKPGKSKGKWSDLPRGWTKKSAESFWNSIGGSVSKCRSKLKDADEISDTGAFCASLKDRIEGSEWRHEKRKSKKKSKKKKANVAPPRSIRVNGQLYMLDE